MPLTLSQKAIATKSATTLAITAKAKALKASGVDVVVFGAGEPDFDTPKNIKDAAIKAIDDGFTKYTPASGIEELKKAICKKFKDFNHLEYEPNEIVISNGGKHSLTNIFQTILNQGDEVIIPTPYWLTYPEIVRLADGVPVFVNGEKENGYKITAKQLKDAVTPATKAVILNTPCNPTGMIYSKKELLAIAGAAVEADIYIIADEMYEYLVYGDNEHVSIGTLGNDIFKRTITCSGLSKTYSMTGWRVGYTGSSAEIAKTMGSVQSHQTSNPNSIAQKAAIEAILGEQAAVETMRLEFDKRRKYMYSRLSAMPLIDTLEPEGAFYAFVDCSALTGKLYKDKEIENAADAADILLSDYNVALIPCADFGAPNHVRLSYAVSMEQIEKGLDRIEEFLGNFA
ncbi:MAG: pyridoxal phosphate-dependent aminotransferase [Lachnospiraceae bacterium]|jgi:aspartate aminotransferase|nr:pyridoxal phosphate-dependent aminotransferase [Lachnospiraceae bacterium]